MCEAVCWCTRAVVDNEVCFFVKYSQPNNHGVLESCCVLNEKTETISFFVRAPASKV